MRKATVTVVYRGHFMCMAFPVWAGEPREMEFRRLTAVEVDLPHAAAVALYTREGDCDFLIRGERVEPSFVVAEFVRRHPDLAYEAGLIDAVTEAEGDDSRGGGVVREGSRAGSGSRRRSYR